MVDGSGVGIDGGLDIGVGPSIIAGEPKNKKPNELTLLEVVAAIIVAALVAANSRSGSLRPA